MSDGARSQPAVVAGSIVLGIAVFVMFVLVLLLAFRPPSTVVTVEVGAPQAEQCPVVSGGEGATACYRFDVTNTGQADGVATCLVTPAVGTEAQFANGASSVGVRLQAGEVKSVYTRVIPADGGDEIRAPSLSCQV